MSYWIPPHARYGNNVFKDKVVFFSFQWKHKSTSTMRYVLILHLLLCSWWFLVVRPKKAKTGSSLWLSVRKRSWLLYSSKCSLWCEGPATEASGPPTTYWGGGPSTLGQVFKKLLFWRASVNVPLVPHWRNLYGTGAHMIKRKEQIRLQRVK